MREEHFQPARILIIDDEITHVDFLTTILGKEGYSEIKGVTDPRAAVVEFEKFQPDIVVLDLSMPEVSGLQVLKQLRAVIPRDTYLPIIVVTADFSTESRREALAAGANDFVVKPYEAWEIVLRVANLLETRFLHLEAQNQNLILQKRVAERTAKLREANAGLEAGVAERERAKEEWAQSFDGIPDLICVLDMAGKILRANQAMRERFEPVHGDLIGLDYRACYCGTELPKTQPPCAEVLATGRPVMWEGEVATMEGWFWIASYPLFDAEGKQWGAVSVVRDISARQQAEEALREAQEKLEDRVRARTEELALANSALSTASVIQRRVQDALEESESRLRVLFDENPLTLVTVDAAGVIRSISRFGAHQLGYGVEELVGRPVALLYHDEDRQTAAQSLDDCLKQPGEREAIELRKVRKDGSVLWARETARALPSADNKLVLLVCEDITERKRMSEALRESEARYQRIVAHAPGMVYQFLRRPDGSFSVPYVSEGCRNLFGLEPGEIEADAHRLLSLIDAEDLGEFRRTVDQSIAGRAPWNWIGRFRHPSGETKWIEGASLPQSQPNGDVVWDGLLIDITERKRSAALAAASDARYQQIVELAAEGIWVIDAEARTTFANPKMEQMLGTAPGAMLGRSMYDFMDAEGRRIAERNFERRRDGVAEQHEFCFLRVDGSELWALLATNPLPALEGGFAGALAMVTDITERKRAAEQLEASARENSQLASAIANLTSGVVITNPSLPDNPIIFANSAFHTLTGYSAAETLGRNCRFLQGPATDPATVEAIREAIAARRTFTGDLLNYRKDSTPFWNELTITPVFDREGALINYVGLQSDVSERRQTHIALQEAKAEAERANQAKSEFLSRMSHELRTPLNAIIGFSQLLESEGRAAEEADNIAQVLKAGYHLLALINEVLDITGIEAGRETFSIEAVSLPELLPEMISLLRTTAAARQVTLHQSAADCYLLADLQRLKQVLLNLLSNAIKYNREGGSVTLTAAATECGTVRIAVRDTGRGIAPEDAPKVFTPFERLDAGEAAIEGAGLGLAISKRLVEAMRGTLGFESVRGVGSSFWIELPLAETR